MERRPGWFALALESLRWNEQTMVDLAEAFGPRKALKIMFEALVKSVEKSVDDEPLQSIGSLISAPEKRAAISGSGSSVPGSAESAASESVEFFSTESWKPNDFLFLDLGTCRGSGLLLTHAQNRCRYTNRGMDSAFLSGQLLMQNERLRPWLEQKILSMPCWSCAKWYVLKADEFEDQKAMIEYARDYLGWNRTKSSNGIHWSCPLHGT